ncbi:hypothetical protein CJF39_22550, partial [Pseudomonas lundensis]
VAVLAMVHLVAVYRLTGCPLVLGKIKLLKRGVLRYDGQDIPFLCQFTHKKGATRAPKPSPKPKEKQGDGVYLVTEHLMPMASVR